ncbi:ribonuclease HII, partial [Candidatus Peregrinibacteria bacterium CG_4_10_14_3_um_filter_44_21]
MEETSIIIGADEAGRGPWAGPLVAAVCHIPPNTRLPGLNDSKKLSKKAREKLFIKIQEKTLLGIGISEVSEVEQGMKHALNLAYNRALEQIGVKPATLLIDGSDKLDLKYPYKSIIKGDQKERCIMAASII